MNDLGSRGSGDRSSASLRNVLNRNVPLHIRVLPPLDQIRRSVEGITRRWPDAVKAPAEKDREELAQKMLTCVSNWTFGDLTTQRVLSAAVAVFDEQRRTRPDLLQVRNFYLSEIASSDPGAFLDGMVGVYLDSFTLRSKHTRELAEALNQRKADLGVRYRRLLAALPALFQPEEAPSRLAQIMREADDAYLELRSIGFGSPHTSGLAQAAQKAFIDDIAPQLAEAPARQKLFNWVMPASGVVLQQGAGPAVEALLAVWRDHTPPEAVRNELSEAIIAAWNDPRLHKGGIWSGFDPDLKAVLLRWLTHQDMKFFCDMVSATQNSHMWPPRRDFWLRLYDRKMIDEAWVAFGSDALRFAQRNLVRQGKTNVSRRFGRQLDRGGSTSLLIMRMGNKIVVDGCHSYRTHIFRMDERNAPKLYQTQYYCDDIMRASPNSKPHNSIPAWQQWVLQHV